MKENSIEEDIEIIKSLDTLDDIELKNALEHILSDYKRVLKDNEELLQEKINNQKIIVLSQNDMLNYQAGFEDGKNGRTSAVQSIIENQQYYIFQKQIEKYEEHIAKLQKENEGLKEKENKIYKEVQESLAFEKFLIVKERKPDLFNQGRFYISQIIYDILNDVQNPEGIHKENKCIQYIDSIPVQKVKDKIEEIKQEKKKYGNCLIEMYEDELVNRDIKILQGLLEGK